MAVKFSRRRFLAGASFLAGAAVLPAPHLFFEMPDIRPTQNQNTLVVVSIRGGWDALNVVPPIDGPDRGIYEKARPNIRIPVRGAGGAQPISDFLGFHPAMAPLYELYKSQKLAVVHAAGLTYDTRSHFDAMEYIETGTAGQNSTPTGWMTRAMQSAGGFPQVNQLPAAATGITPTSFSGSSDVVSITTPREFTLWYGQDTDADQEKAIASLYSGSSFLAQAGQKTLEAMRLVNSINPNTYATANGARYPDGDFGDNLKTIAELMKSQVGLQMATVDLDGWDTHQYEGSSTEGTLVNQINQLARGLAAFYTDLDRNANRLTVVVLSEFGRRLAENASLGTDHGHGGVMLVLGGQVNGGAVFGAWPGLQNEALYDHDDLNVTTDYRQVLSEILVRRMITPALSTIFPGYTGYKPMGLVQGTDLDIK